MKTGLDRLKKGFTALQPVRLEGVDDWGLSDEDITGELTGTKASPLLFGSFPASRVLADLGSRGILDRIRRRGYDDFELRSEGENAFDNRIRLYGSHPSHPEPCVLMDTRTHRGELVGHSPTLGRDLRIRALIWEWLGFQDPLARFPEGFEALPGQEHPGLGIFRQSVQLMLGYVHEMDVDALVGLPQYFHNAVLYASHFRFFLPRHEAEFQALKRDLMAEGLPRASRAMAEGRVLERESGRRVTWHAAEQVYPIRGEIVEHFTHPAYAAETQDVLRRSHFRLAPVPPQEGK